MSGIGNEALLGGERKAQPLEQLVDRVNQRPHFLRRILFRNGGEIEV